MNTRWLASVSLCLLAGVTNSVNASTMNFSGFSTGDTVGGVQLLYNGSRGVHRTESAPNVQAGELVYTVGANSGPYFSSGDSIVTFCIDIWDNATAGGSSRNIGNLTDTPLSNGAFVKMEHYRAQLIGVLWALHRESVVDNVTAAAFQFAIWEIAHEDSFVGDKTAVDAHGAGLVLGDGNLRINHGNSDIFDTANTYLNAAYAAWVDGSVSGASLRAVYGNNFQDVIIVIPLPAPAMMAGLGLLAIPLMRRRMLRV